MNPAVIALAVGVGLAGGGLLLFSRWLGDAAVTRELEAAKMRQSLDRVCIDLAATYNCSLEVAAETIRVAAMQAMRGSKDVSRWLSWLQDEDQVEWLRRLNAAQSAKRKEEA